MQLSIAPSATTEFLNQLILVPEAEMMTVRNPDLTVNDNNLAHWNTPERRRGSFRRLHSLHRRGLTLRAADILPLRQDHRHQLGNMRDLNRLLGRPEFCAISVIQGTSLLFEAYAPDFGPDHVHSMQSITKTFAHLVCGRLIDQGLVDPSAFLGRYLPELDSGYSGFTVQQALDMDISNNFEEDYAAPYSPAPPRGAPIGYGREEIAMGWRLPPAGEPEFGVRAFATGLVRTKEDRKPNATMYKSANTDVLGWLAERVSHRPLTDHLAGIINAAGIEGAFHISLDRDWVPVLSGGGVMTARDLARYGLIFARRGRGADGSMVGSGALVTDALGGLGTLYDPLNPALRYRNHLFATRTWVGHAGYAGQFMMASPDKEAAISFFSVIETPNGEQEGYFAEVIATLERIMDML